VNQTAWTTFDRTDITTVTATNLHDHVFDLDRPAVLAVEDNDSDGCFIASIVGAFGARDLQLAISEGWLILAHGGGNAGACRRAREEHAKFRRLRRVAVLLDSDREIPGEATKSHHQAQALDQKGIFVHVLELREAENYIPNKALQRLKPYRDSSRKLDALKALTPSQRGHFDMKRGFGKSSWTKQADLYGDVTPRNVFALRDGFGNNVMKILAAQMGNLSESDFTTVGPCVAEELHRILAMLRKIV
jgi:hypothetical protein